MSLGDIAQALALAEKGLLSPDSFRKVVSRVVRDTEGASGKNEEKVCLAWVYRLRHPLFFFSQASAPVTSSSGSSTASGKRSGGQSNQEFVQMLASKCRSDAHFGLGGGTHMHVAGGG